MSIKLYRSQDITNNQLLEEKGECDDGTHGVIQYFILMIVTVPNLNKLNNTKFKTTMYCTCSQMFCF